LAPNAIQCSFGKAHHHGRFSPVRKWVVYTSRKCGDETKTWVVAGVPNDDNDAVADAPSNIEPTQGEQLADAFALVVWSDC